MNSGGGTFTLGGGSTWKIAPGSTNELVLAAMTSGIVINGPIINGSAAGAVTVMGESGQTVTLAGVSTYTGVTTIDSGTLSLTGTLVPAAAAAQRLLISAPSRNPAPV